MRQRILVLALVATLTAVPVAGAVVGSPGGAADAHRDAEAANGTGDVAPGQQLSGVVGVQQAEIEGEVEARAAGLELEQADSEAAVAAVIAGQVDSIRERLESLEQRRATLRTAHGNGSLGDGAYRARMAELVARSQSLQRMANQTAAVGEQLSGDLLADHGVDAEALRNLSDRTGELTGPEVSDIAETIAGPVVDADPLGSDGPLNVTVGEAGNVSIGEPGDGILPGDDDQPGDGGTGDTPETPTDDGPLDNVTDDPLDNVTDDPLDNVTDDPLDPVADEPVETNLTEENGSLDGPL